MASTLDTRGGWCIGPGKCSAWASGNADLLARTVLVRALGDDRRHGEVLSGRRRRDFPFESPGPPWVRGRLLTGEQRMGEVDERQGVADREDRGACRREHVEHLEFRRIRMVAPRHPEV